MSNAYDPYPLPPEPTPAQHSPSFTVLGLTDSEDTLMFGCVGTILIVIFCALAYWATQPHQPQLCDDPKSFTCLDYRVQQCVASEKYDKDQCVILVGGNK